MKEVAKVVCLVDSLGERRRIIEHTQVIFIEKDT